MSTVSNCVIGIDVSKGCLDICSLNRISFTQVSNNGQGIRRLIGSLLRVGPDLVVLEATGGYESPLVRALHAAALPVHVANPRRVRDFAKGMGILAKTDQVDAGAIQLYGQRVCPEPMTALDPAAEHIADLQARHRQLTDMQTAEKNRLAMAPPAVQPGIREHLGWLKKQIKELEQEIAKKIDETPHLAQVARIVCTVPGVGPATTAALAAQLPELGQVGAKQLCALVGVAPFACDSGQHKGKRRIWGGRRRIRSALYMAVLTTVRLTPTFRQYYESLLASGKLKKVALTACIRKLVVTLNAMVKTNTTWNPKPVRA